MKSRAGKRQREEKDQKKEEQKRKSQKKEDAAARKGRKVAKHCVFPMICGSGGSKSRLAKAAGAEPAGQMRDEKLHAVVARSTFASQNVQKTWCSEHFWKLGCRKSARCCGAKHISKSKCAKHSRFGPLLAVAMSKKCTPLWRKAHFEVKMLKNTRGSDHFWRFRCRKSARRCGAKHISKSKCSKTPGVRTTFRGSDVASLHYTTLQDITLHYTPVHYITLHYTPVHSIALNYTTPHYITLNDIAPQIDR